MAFNNRGNALRDKGDLVDSLKDCNEAIRLNPDLFRAFNNRGLTRNSMGNKDGAREDENEAIRLGYQA